MLKRRYSAAIEYGLAHSAAVTPKSGVTACIFPRAKRCNAAFYRYSAAIECGLAHSAAVTPKSGVTACISPRAKR
ncbi:hypothetical protein NNL21_10410 [Paenibacillus mendelii]|nr:hypothetical protein [Paenibacillus mendelii]